MKTLIATLLFPVLAAFGLAACDSGLTTQEAAARCDIERTNNPSMTQEIYQQCIGCFETCADSCKALGHTPEEYACPAP